jgi:hypothetical protein
LSWRMPRVGEYATTYAFPNHAITNTADRQQLLFRPDLYSGRIEAVADFRDRVMVPYPYLQVGFRIHGGASGGPVVGAHGAVIGVNCTENIPTGPAFAAQMRCLAGAFLEEPPCEDEAASPRISFQELVSSGALNVSGYSDTASNQMGHTVKLDLPVTALEPEIILGFAI